MAFSWLLILRWGAVACQGVLFIIAAVGLGIELPVAVVSSIIVFEGVSNLFFSFLLLRQSVPDWLIALVMFLDSMLLTLLLMKTGGAMNPFTFLYLVHIALGAILMRPSWAWSLLLFTILCYGILFIPGIGHLAEIGTDINEAALSAGQGGEICHHTPGGETDTHLALHLQGMWVAFAVTAIFIVFFLGRIQKALEVHQEVRASLKEERVRSEKLASLATLAAGAAHEFSTPLSTIAVAAGEMCHALKEKGGDPFLMEDALLIRRQVDRCKEIIFQMAADAGEHLGEAVEEFMVSDLVERIIESCSPECRSKIMVADSPEKLRISMPYRTFKRIVRGLIKNGCDATPPDGRVEIGYGVDGSYFTLTVTDNGVGMDSDELEKACEPFFTTKEPGKGLGLGLYLARTVAERYDGDLSLESFPGGGTRARLRLDMARIAVLGPSRDMEVKS